MIFTGFSHYQRPHPSQVQLCLSSDSGFFCGTRPPPLMEPPSSNSILWLLFRTNGLSFQPHLIPFKKSLNSLILETGEYFVGVSKTKDEQNHQELNLPLLCTSIVLRYLVLGSLLILVFRSMDLKPESLGSNHGSTTS